MGSRWEYAVLLLMCDPGVAVDKFWGYMAFPGETKYQELGIVENILEKFNSLGRDGWEMVGSPTYVNSVFTYKAGNDTWHDRAYPLETKFYFKRELDR